MVCLTIVSLFQNPSTSNVAALQRISISQRTFITSNFWLKVFPGDRFSKSLLLGPIAYFLEMSGYFPGSTH